MGLIHRRLKVLDLGAAAAQPMCADGLALVYNGEIYNYRELRRELEGAGAAFASSGDTEVVLQAYRAWGPDCFRRFEGMWALAILDGRRRRLVLSRDRFGIKPLYYARQPDGLAFASEIKALLELPAVGREPDRRSMARFLAFGISDDGERTFFRDVVRFPAAHWADVNLDQPGSAPAFHRYWRLDPAPFAGTHDEAVSRFGDLFRVAMTGHHRSDVASGSCLSGGIDSSAIVCTAAQLRGHDDLASCTWKGFGYVPEDPSLSERPFMEAAARAAGAELTLVGADAATFSRLLPDFVSVHDEPVGSPSVFAQWLVFRRAAEAGVRVMLDGQGADETLGGYLGYVLTAARSDLVHGRIGSYLRLRRAYRRATGDFPLAVSRVLADAVLPAAVRSRLMARDERSAAVMLPDLAGIARHETEADLAPRHDLKATLAADLQARILPALLRYEDSNSMAASIEARVPFLDRRLVEFAFSLPDHSKVHGMVRKRVLGDAMAGVVPDVVRRRTDKIGFRAEPSWLRTHVAKRIDELASNANAWERDWFAEERARSILARFALDGGSEDAAWRLFSVKSWARRL